MVSCSVADLLRPLRQGNDVRQRLAQIDRRAHLSPSSATRWLTSSTVAILTNAGL